MLNGSDPVPAVKMTHLPTGIDDPLGGTMFEIEPGYQ